MGSSAAGACAAAAQVDDAEKRRIAVVALGKIGHAGPAAMEALRERLQDPSLAVRVATVEAAEQLGTAARPLTDDLVALYDRDEDPQIDNAIVEAFLQIQPETSLPPQFVDPLVHILTRRASGDGYAAGRIVARIGAPALPALIENIKSDSRLRSWRAAYTVGQMGRIAEPAVPALEDALKRAEERNRNTWAKMVRTALKQIRG
jgi:HEAT repeat protein